jgi:hypothetical protein
MVCQTRVTIEGRCHCTHGEEVDSYNNVLFYTANDEQMDQRTLSALSYLSRGYDMVQVYNKMSDYNDKELWSANKPSWDTVYQTPKESISVCL